MEDKAEKPAKGQRGRGRPHGPGLSTRERNRLIAQGPVKPLEVMAETLARRWKAAQAIQDDPEARGKAEDAAMAVARDLAPYLHPKLQATTLKGDADAPVNISLGLPDALVLRSAIRGKG